MQHAARDRRSRTGALRTTLSAALAGLALALPTTAQANAVGQGNEVTVMTRNLYLGADLTSALAATNTTELAVAASAILDTVGKTDFPARAELLAQEIVVADPDLVGLQEVALWRADREGSPDGPLTPATEPLYNFRGLLMRELRAMRAPYRVVQVQREADIEVPTGGGFDGRLTIRDMVLARDGVTVAKGQSQNFATNLVIPNAGGVQGLNLTVHRGWDMLRANAHGNQFRFVNTHLEAFNPLVRQAQAAELVSPVGPATARQPMVLVGDLNSDDDTVQGADQLAYQTLTQAGLVERSTSDASCCYPTPTLDNPSDVFDHQVDHVMVNDAGIELVDSYVTGNDRALRTPATRPGAVPSHGRLWPSDHGGVVSVLGFPAG